MAYILKKIGKVSNIPSYHFECDNNEDVLTIPLTGVPMSSTCYVINEGTTYTLNSEREWIITMRGSTGGGGSAANGDAVLYTEQKLSEEQQMQARKNLGLYRKDVIETLTCVYDYSHESNTQTTDGTKLYYVGDIGGDEGLYYITESNTNRTYAVQFEMCGSPYCYKGEFTTTEDADYVVYLTLKSGTWDGVTFPHDGSGVYVTAPLYSYDIYISKIEEARIYPIPEVYIPDTIARKTDIPEAGGGDSGGTFVINVNDNTVDRTFEEAVAAFYAGQQVYVLYTPLDWSEAIVMRPETVNETQMSFYGSSFTWSSMQSMGSINYFQFYLRANTDNVVVNNYCLSLPVE